MVKYTDRVTQGNECNVHWRQVTHRSLLYSGRAARGQVCGIEEERQIQGRAADTASVVNDMGLQERRKRRQRWDGTLRSGIFFFLFCFLR